MTSSAPDATGSTQNNKTINCSVMRKNLASRARAFFVKESKRDSTVGVSDASPVSKQKAKDTEIEERPDISTLDPVKQTPQEAKPQGRSTVMNRLQARARMLVSGAKSIETPPSMDQMITKATESHSVTKRPFDKVNFRV